MSIETTILSDPQTFTTLKNDWMDLLSRSVTNYVFQSPQFQEAWWQALGSGEVCIITVRDGDRLIGLAPFYIEPNERGRQICFIGCVNVSDYLDILVDKNHQQEVYDALETTLKTEFTEWDRLFLCSLPEASPTRVWLPQAFPNATEKQQDISPYIPLPKTWDEYLAGIDRKQRHEIKRKMRRLEETDHTFEVISTEKEAHQALQDFIQLHRASSAEKNDFWDEKHLGFFSNFIPAAGAQGWLKLFFLKIENVRAAAMLVLDYNNQYLLYNSGFDPAQFKNVSPGNVLTAYTIRTAIVEKKDIYDFLRGDEEYKFRFGAVAKPVFDITVAQK